MPAEVCDLDTGCVLIFFSIIFAFIPGKCIVALVTSSKEYCNKKGNSHFGFLVVKGKFELSSKQKMGSPDSCVTGYCSIQ